MVDVFKAKGRDNLRNFNERINVLIKILNDAKSDYIFILVDRENDPCISYTKDNIHDYYNKKQINIIAVKAIESWFLADSITLSKLFNKRDYQYLNPEEVKGEAFIALNNEFRKYQDNRGISKKRNLHAKHIVGHGFSIRNAAKHPNCPSANYFLQKLIQLNPNLDKPEKNNCHRFTD